MRKKKWIEWRKPRFDRSKIKVIKKEDSETSRAINLGKDLTTRWKCPISQQTFDELLDAGLLTLAQMEEYYKSREEEYRSKIKRFKTAAATAEKYRKLALATKIAEHDITTPEGMKAFRIIVKECPEAVNLLVQAQEMKALAGG